MLVLLFQFQLADDQTVNLKSSNFVCPDGISEDVSRLPLISAFAAMGRSFCPIFKYILSGVPIFNYINAPKHLGSL